MAVGRMGGMSRSAPPEAYSVSFSRDVPAGSTRPKNVDVVDIKMPFEGWTNGLTVVWPASDGGVGVRLQRNEGEKLFPRDDENEYEATPIAFGDTFPLRVPIERGEILQAHYVNNDTTNDKFTTVLLGVERASHGRQR